MSIQQEVSQPENTAHRDSLLRDFVAEVDTRPCIVVGSPTETQKFVSQGLEQSAVTSLVQLDCNTIDSVQLLINSIVNEVARFNNRNPGFIAQPDALLAQWTSNKLRGLGDIQVFSKYLRALAASIPKDETCSITLYNLDAMPAHGTDINDYLRVVRAAYNGRALDYNLTRINFVHTTQQDPGALMAEDAATPFNIGRVFKLEEPRSPKPDNIATRIFKALKTLGHG